MDVLFCLDPIAVDYIRDNLQTNARIMQLPDSFVREEIPRDRIDRLREEFQIESGRRVVLLLGILDRRKGPVQLLQAIDAMDDASKSKMCLLMAGKIDEQIESEVLDHVDKLQRQGKLQLVMKNSYITDTLVQDYYELADVALTTYQNHMGMSSALIRAALAKIPVLSSSYGLMGELVLRHQLGTVVDTTSPVEFTAAIEKVVNEDVDRLFDLKEALEFADSHSPDALGRTLKDWVSG